MSTNDDMYTDCSFVHQTNLHNHCLHHIYCLLRYSDRCSDTGTDLVGTCAPLNPNIQQTRNCNWHSAAITVVIRTKRENSKQDKKRLNKHAYKQDSAVLTNVPVVLWDWAGGSRPTANFYQPVLTSEPWENVHKPHVTFGLNNRRIPIQYPSWSAKGFSESTMGEAGIGLWLFLFWHTMPVGIHDLHYKRKHKHLSEHCWFQFHSSEIFNNRLIFVT